MSVFTNPMDAAAESATAYARAVLDLVGQKEPMVILRNAAANLKQAVVGLSASQLKQPEAPGKWSIVAVVQHLADTDLVWAWRLRLVAGQDRPKLTGYDQDSWARRLHYEQAELREAMELFRVVRGANLRLIDSLPMEDLQRVGVHMERGDESIEYMIRLYAGHDLVHLKQIERIRQHLS